MNNLDFDTKLPEESGHLAEAVREVKNREGVREGFKISLRNKIQEKISKTKIRNNVTITEKIMNFFMNKFTLGLATGLVVAVAAVSININGLWGSKRAPVAQFLPAEYKVAELPSESFGSLTSVSLVEANAQNQNKAVGGETAPVLMTAENLPVATPVTSASVPVQDTEGKMIAPELYPAPQPYSFKYTGGELPELPKTQPVYKRVNSLTQSNNGNLFDLIRLGLFNINKLINPQLSSISFSEDREYGYTVNVDFENSNISIYQNWKQWPTMKPMCVEDTDYCTYPEPPKKEDMPKDETLIQIADDFLKDYDIPRSNFGSPFVDNSYRVYYEREIYAPEIVTVIYPFMVDNNQVFDEGGRAVGLNISINIRDKKVTNVYNLTPQQYQKSVYTGETDSKKIIGLAEQGNFRGYPIYPNEQGGSALVVKLGTPKQVMASVWQSNGNEKGYSSELYVPALSFPILNRDEVKNSYYSDSVIIPLVKDILDGENINNRMTPQPVPYAEPSAK